MKKMVLINLLLIILLMGCKYNSEVEEEGNLTVSFVNAIWDGQTVPKEGQCKQCGGEGKSPALRLGNIPQSANIVVVEFNDYDYPPLANGGGHGALYVKVNNQATVTIPSVNEETFDLPPGVYMEHEHYAPIGQPGAYFGPCGCGGGNRYGAVLKAINRTSSGDTILRYGSIGLGKF